MVTVRRHYDRLTDRRTATFGYHDAGSGPGMPTSSLAEMQRDVVRTLGRRSYVSRSTMSGLQPRCPDGKQLGGDPGMQMAVLSGQESLEPANYFCSAGGTVHNEGIYLCGSKNGKPAVLRVAEDGTPAWAVELSENISITSCSYVRGTALALTGTLPPNPEQQVDSFYLLMRLDTLLLFHEKFRTHPIRPLRASSYDGFVFISGGRSEGRARVTF